RSDRDWSSDVCSSDLKVRRIAHIHPDYAYGRNAFDHFNIVMKKLVPGAQVVSEGWPKLFSTDFTSHITKAIAAKPDLFVSSIWEIGRASCRESVYNPI